VRKCLNSELLRTTSAQSRNAPFQIGIAATQLTLRHLFTAILRGYNSASPGHLERFNLSKRRTLMTEQNRVLARTGARTLTQAEMAEVGGGFSTSVIITDVLTNFGSDFSVDHIEN